VWKIFLVSPQRAKNPSNFAHLYTLVCSILVRHVCFLCFNSFLSTHQLTRRIRREVKKNSQKFMALPFVLTFEIKPGKEITQFPSKFEKRHLNGRIWRPFSEIQSEKSKMADLRLSVTNDLLEFDSCWMEKKVAMEECPVIKKVNWSVSPRIRVKNRGKRAILS